MTGITPRAGPEKYWSTSKKYFWPFHFIKTVKILKNGLQVRSRVHFRTESKVTSRATWPPCLLLAPKAYILFLGPMLDGILFRPSPDHTPQTPSLSLSSLENP